MLTTIFFDAGNTLVFANMERTLAALHARGVRPRSEQLHAAERQAKTELDRANTAPGRYTDRQYWDTYYSFLLKSLELEDAKLQESLVTASRTSGNWDVVRPGTRENLLKLGRKYRLGVISNSDGGMENLLRSCGLGECFLGYTDSGHVGHEKPHPAIFQAALQQLAAKPESSLYVGDVYSVDYVGATRTGMKAMLFDVSGTYRESTLPRVESLEELSARLYSFPGFNVSRVHRLSALSRNLEACDTLKGVPAPFSLLLLPPLRYPKAALAIPRPNFLTH
jgi:HAD superfamily hydrolase (TIGR01509 family)